MIKLRNITTNSLTPHCAASKRLLEARTWRTYFERGMTENDCTLDLLHVKTRSIETDKQQCTETGASVLQHNLTTTTSTDSSTLR
jgi:hypothetical protein